MFSVDLKKEISNSGNGKDIFKKMSIKVHTKKTFPSFQAWNNIKGDRKSI